MSILYKEKADTSKEVNELLEKLMQINPVILEPEDSSNTYSLADFKEGEQILKISDKNKKPIVLLIDKSDLPLSKCICYLSDLNFKSNFSYIYNVDINNRNQKDYRLEGISEFKKASYISNIITKRLESIENENEEKLLRNLQNYARNCVTEYILKDVIKLLLVCGEENDVFVDKENSQFSLKLLTELKTDYTNMPLTKFISKYEQYHKKIVTKRMPIAFDLLCSRIQTESTPFEFQLTQNKENSFSKFILSFKEKIKQTKKGVNSEDKLSTDNENTILLNEKPEKQTTVSFKLDNTSQDKSDAVKNSDTPEKTANKNSEASLTKDSKIAKSSDNTQLDASLEKSTSTKTYKDFLDKIKSHSNANTNAKKKQEQTCEPKNQQDDKVK